MNFIDLIRRAGGTIRRTHSDEAREFLAYETRRWLRTQGIWQSYTAGDDPQSNGLAEAVIGIYKNKVTTNLLASGLWT